MGQGSGGGGGEVEAIGRWLQKTVVPCALSAVFMGLGVLCWAPKPYFAEPLQEQAVSRGAHEPGGPRPPLSTVLTTLPNTSVLLRYPLLAAGASTPRSA